MSLNKEDKADVSRSMGKALANKVSKATRDFNKQNKNYSKEELKGNFVPGKGKEAKKKTIGGESYWI